ncbi:hypothetical protein NL108_017538 [Boleophthalmus pectinirostris]|nr:hypothetical protein NL108_017538 [Boleophthalmus pectinirostris]
MRKHEEVTVFLVILIIFVIEVITGPICHRAEYLIGEECCPMCPVGTRVNKHCTEFRSTSCLPCDSGTYMDEPTGRTECLRCRMCAAGSGLRVKVSCSSTSNSVCEPEDGFFCVGSSDEGNCEASQKHSLCSPGEFIQKPGSSSTDTVCSPCPPDSFSNGTLSSCRPHTRCEEKNKITVKEGTSQSDAECGEKDSTVAVGAWCRCCIARVISCSWTVLYHQEMRVCNEKASSTTSTNRRTEPSGGSEKTTYIMKHKDHVTHLTSTACEKINMMQLLMEEKLLMQSRSKHVLGNDQIFVFILTQCDQKETTSVELQQKYIQRGNDVRSDDSCCIYVLSESEAPTPVFKLQLGNNGK